MAQWALAAVVLGSLVYCVLVVLAARRYLGVPRRKFERPTPISILKPLAGADEGLDENLRSFFEQDYSYFEIVFAVGDAGDAAVDVAERLRAQY
ncbi:MAG: ceramide glucosyltransferase, partial [Acidobacteriota bacterium]